MSTEASSHRPKKRNRLMGVLALSTALHAPLFTVEEEFCDNVTDTIYVVKENIRRTINASPEKRRSYVDSIQRRGTDPKLRDFYLDTEEIEGAIDEDEKERAKEELNTQIKRFKELSEAESDQLKVLQEITDYAHEDDTYEETNTRLSTFLLERKGNCRARQKATATIVEAVYPDLKIVSQRIKKNGVPHTRTLVQIDEKWYAMESDTSQALSTEDLAGSVLFAKGADINKYTGKPSVGTYITPSQEQKIESETRFTITDELLSRKMPVSWNEIRNFVSEGEETKPKPEKPIEIETLDWDKYVKASQDRISAGILNHLQHGQRDTAKIMLLDNVTSLRREQLMKIVKLYRQKSTKEENNFHDPNFFFSLWSNLYPRRRPQNEVIKLAEDMIQGGQTNFLVEVMDNASLSCTQYEDFRKKIEQLKKPNPEYERVDLDIEYRMIQNRCFNNG